MISEFIEDEMDITNDEVFDLNRHLLDIATLSSSKMSRPKSWSPEEGNNPSQNSTASTEYYNISLPQTQSITESSKL